MGKDFENPFGVVAPKSGRVRNMSELIDSMVIPGVQGGPLMNVIAAKAVAFKEALSPDFKAYQQQVVTNARIVNTFMVSFWRVVSSELLVSRSSWSDSV